jgi:hypothetical protein
LKKVNPEVISRVSDPDRIRIRLGHDSNPDWEFGFKSGLGIQIGNPDWESGFRSGWGIRIQIRMGNPDSHPYWESGFRSVLGIRIWILAGQTISPNAEKFGNSIFAEKLRLQSFFVGLEDSPGD